MMVKLLKPVPFTKLILIVCSIILLSNCSHEVNGDLIITNAKVYDGSGSDPVIKNIIVENGKISAIGPKLSCLQCQQIDGQGKSLAPGFIDLHAHLESLPQILSAESAIHMGVTTALGGPDGSSPINLRKFLGDLEQQGIGINVAYLIGHNSVRSEVMQLDGRAPTSAELDEMKKLISKGMKDGAFGISTGLKYLPGTFAKIEEVIELSKVVSDNKGIYTSHLREEGLGLIEGVQEAISIAATADIPVVLTHHKAIGKPMWGASVKTLAMVDSARSVGLDVMVDQYPYTASYTGLSVLIPPWALEGDTTHLL